MDKGRRVLRRPACASAAVTASAPSGDNWRSRARPAMRNARAPQGQNSDVRGDGAERQSCLLPLTEPRPSQGRRRLRFVVLVIDPTDELADTAAHWRTCCGSVTRTARKRSRSFTRQRKPPLLWSATFGRPAASVQVSHGSRRPHGARPGAALVVRLALPPYILRARPRPEWVPISTSLCRPLGSCRGRGHQGPRGGLAQRTQHLMGSQS